MTIPLILEVIELFIDDLFAGLCVVEIYRLHERTVVFFDAKLLTNLVPDVEQISPNPLIFWEKIFGATIWLD